MRKSESFLNSINPFFNQLNLKTMSINAFIIYLSIEMKYSIHTVEAYKHDLRAFERFIKSECEKEEEDCPLERADQEDIKKWIISLSNQSMSFRSINRKLSALKPIILF